MTTSELNALYYADKQGVWYSPKWEPNPALDAWIILDTGEDSYEVVKYGGYNADGEMTWAKNCRTIRRGMYLPVNAEDYALPATPTQLTLFD